MGHTLHVINGSHPCAAVLRALELKGIDVRIAEYMPPLHPALVKLRAGSTRVPLLVLDGGERVPGSRRIMQRLDALQPNPPLYPKDRVAIVEEADRWGDEVLQSAARRILWGAMRAHPGALYSFQAGSKLPSLPRPIVRLAAPVIFAGEYRLNQITPEKVAADIAALPEMLAKIREFEAAGAFGEQDPTAADLQIGSSLQLLRAVDDLRPVIDADASARGRARWLAPAPGNVPAGAFPAELIEQAGATTGRWHGHVGSAPSE